MSFSFNPGNELNGGRLESVAQDVSTLTAKPDVKIPTAGIGLWFDPRYFHTRIDDYQPPSYYTDYLLTATHSERMQKHQAEQARHLLGLHEGHPRSFVDVGCGDGSFLDHMKSLGAEVTGIEPSARFAGEARKRGLRVIDGYVSSREVLTPDRFDLFASRQVFEHVPDPVDLLTGIRNLLNPGAVGLIEVPNGFRSVREKRFYDFFPDHVQHYSVNSLVQLATLSGFNAVECRESFGRDYLELWLRLENRSVTLFDQLREERERVSRNVVSVLQACRTSGMAPVALWGCGAKTLSILAFAGESLTRHVDFLIDSDPHKHGKHVPNTRLPVLGVHDASARSPQCVLILALSYREEIARLIRNHIPGCRRIITVDNAGEIVDL